MKKNTVLTNAQQELVENHLSVVYWVIKKSIHVNERIYGFEYDDLYQEGCMWLCHAAATYDASRSSFPTYAKTVVRNGLVAYCRGMCATQRHFCTLDMDGQEITAADAVLQNPSNEFDAIETSLLLASAAKGYKGVAKLGIEALELKIKGMTTTEIAALYQVPVPHVAAWISRSVKKLRKDKKFLAGIL